MKQFLDFLPLVVFFAFYKIYDIYAATAALIVATAILYPLRSGKHLHRILAAAKYLGQL